MTFNRKKKLKKKKTRQAPGVSSSALQEAHEIFGDVDELLMLRKQGLEKDVDTGAVKRLEDEFEPFIVSEKYMTPKDDIIRETDVPERIQVTIEGFPVVLTLPNLVYDRVKSIKFFMSFFSLQLYEDVTGPPPIDDQSIEEESTWIYNQLTTDSLPLFHGGDHAVREISKEDIGNVLTMLHVQKLDVR